MRSHGVFFFTMKPYRIKAAVYCEETQAVHTITVAIDPKTLTITDRYSPCDINDIAPELALCCPKPACVQSFDEHMPADKTAYQHPVVMRSIIQKRSKLRVIERRLVREYILAVFDGERQPPNTLLPFGFGFARNPDIYRTVLDTVGSIQRMQPGAYSTAESFHLVNGHDSIRKVDTQFFAQLWSEILRKSFQQENDSQNVPIVLWPIIVIGILFADRKPSHAQLAWNILQPAIDDYLTQIPDPSKLLLKMVKEYVRYAVLKRRGRSVGYAILKELARLQAKHFRSKNPRDIDDATLLTARLLAPNDIQAIYREYPQEYLEAAMKNAQPTRLDKLSKNLV